MTGLPLLLHLERLRVVVVGAGAVAAAKLTPLLEAGADVHVIAPDAAQTIRDAAAGGRLTWHERDFADGDLAGAYLVVAATGDAAVNGHVAAEAADRATPCVRVDGGGTASLPGAVRRGPLTIAVSTDGGAPALAGRLRRELADTYGPEYGELAALLGELRRDPAVQAVLAELDDAGRAARWRSVLDTDILTLIRTGHVDHAREVALSCLSSSSG